MGRGRDFRLTETRDRLTRSWLNDPLRYVAAIHECVDAAATLRPEVRVATVKRNAELRLSSRRVRARTLAPPCCNRCEARRYAPGGSDGALVGLDVAQRRPRSVQWTRRAPNYGPRRCRSIPTSGVARAGALATSLHGDRATSRVCGGTDRCSRHRRVQKTAGRGPWCQSGKGGEITCAGGSFE